MGFNIPNSPRGQCDAAVQWTGTAEPTLAPSGAVLGEGFWQSLVARRRNAIVPGSLSFDVLGSPRSPHVFLTQEHRRFLAQSQDHGQQTTSSHAAGTKAASVIAITYNYSYNGRVFCDAAGPINTGIAPHHGHFIPPLPTSESVLPSIRAFMSGGSQGDWHSPADRLALFMQRYAIAEDRVAHQLNWTVEKLRVYLSPEARRLKAASDIVDTAVDKLLMKYRVALAHKTLMTASSKPLTPIEASLRRSSAPTQFGRNVIDRRSIIHADVTPTQLAEEEAEQAAGTVAGAANRKRKRKVIVQPLAGVASNTVKDDGSSATDADSTTDQLDVRKPRRVSVAELICPIRLDVDLDGVRFQDTFLLNAANPGCSPEAIAAQIAHDEKMNEKLKDAIAESIRRQILTLTSCVSTEQKPERLYPIYLDLIINGFSLRDQFEWDITNDFTAAQKFASTLCADLKLSAPFETAIIFSIYEQVAAYRTALSGGKWIGNNPFHVKGTSVTLPTANTGYTETMPPLDDVIRDATGADLWQPVLSELSREERTYLSARFTASRAPTSWKSPSVASQVTDGRTLKRPQRQSSKENRPPRPINPFIVYCQMQKEALGKTRRSASEMRKIMGDMWRKCTEEEKEYYTQLTEVENEKRRRDHVLDMRDRAIAEWEEDESRRKGLLASSTLEASAEHFRGLLLENYMSERNEVDANRAESGSNTGEDDEFDEDHES